MQRNKSSPLQFQRRFVSEIELEQVTGISRRTWQKQRLLNRGPRYYKIHGSVRYDLEEVVNWIKAMAVPGPDTLAVAPRGRP
jgi:predicted DNA-binding transcriptional regulator AlpA